MGLEEATIDRNEAKRRMLEYVGNGEEAVSELQRTKAQLTTLRQIVSANTGGEFQPGDLASLDARIAELTTQIKDFAAAL